MTTLRPRSVLIPDGKLSAMTMGVVQESATDHGVTYIDGLGGSVTSYSYSDPGRVEVVGTGTGVGSLDGQQIDFELSFTCP